MPIRNGLTAEKKSQSRLTEHAAADPEKSQAGQRPDLPSFRELPRSPSGPGFSPTPIRFKHGGTPKGVPAA